MPMASLEAGSAAERAASFINNQRTSDLPPGFSVAGSAGNLHRASGVPRVSGARGEDGNWRPSPPACQTGKRRRRSTLLLGEGVWGPSRQRFLEYLGVNGTHFWIALTPFSTQRVRLTSAESALPCYRGLGRGLGRSPSRQRFWEHLGVNGTNFWIALTPFSTRRVRLASAGGALPRDWGSGAEPQPLKPLGEFRCKWNPF